MTGGAHVHVAIDAAGRGRTRPRPIDVIIPRTSDLHPLPAGHQTRVLVVDDEESIRAFAARALREGGYDVTVASGGPEALLRAEHDPPFALAVVDVRMPEMNGVELVRRLRERDPDMKILYFTSYSDSLFAEKGTLWENEAFVEKPISIRGLLEAVSLLVFGHTHGPEAPPSPSP